MENAPKHVLPPVAALLLHPNQHGLGRLVLEYSSPSLGLAVATADDIVMRRAR